MDTTTSTNKKIQLIPNLIVWTVVILVSLLPDLLFREINGTLPIWVYRAKISLIALLLVSTFIMPRMRQLRIFAILLLGVYLFDWGSSQFASNFNLSTWFSRFNPFVRNIGTVEISRLATALLVVALMLLLTRHFSNFFLVKGDLKAIAAPLPLIMSRPSKWNILGPCIAGAMCLGLIVFTLVFGSLPSPSNLQSVIPLLPFVFLFAVVNSFAEEMIYRAPWLSTLEGVIGPTQALLVTAVYFGLAHFYGVPYGITGVIMAFIPGWLMGKAMLETRGFTWAWFIHFCMDFTIFFFVALGSVKPGG